MTKPVRIQRKRTKGWRMPPNTVSVTRPGKWGNPFDFRSSDCCWLALSYGCRGDRLGRQEASVKAFREWIEPHKGQKLVRLERGVRFGNDEKNSQIGPRFIVGPPPAIDAVRTELRGKNLACFCRLCDVHKNGKPIGVACLKCDPCHADTLLELANPQEPKP